MLRRSPLKRRSQVRERTKETPRRNFAKHEAWVRGFTCLLFGHADHKCSGKTEFAHVRRDTDGGEGLKPSSWWGNPMCEGAHELQHRIGEPAFERRFGVKLKANALKLAYISPDMAMREAMAEAQRREPHLFEI